MHLAEMAGTENSDRSIENIVLSHSLTYKESSISSHAVDKCTKAEARRRTFLETNQIVICATVDLD